MSCWCSSAQKPAEPELELPTLVMPTDMLRSFFTRIKLQIATLESETMDKQEREGISPEGFDEIANDLSTIAEREIAGVRDSYIRSVAVYRKKQLRGESVSELDRVHAARSKLSTLLNSSIEGPGRMRISTEAPSQKRRVKHQQSSVAQTPSTAADS